MANWVNVRSFSFIIIIFFDISLCFNYWLVRAFEKYQYNIRKMDIHKFIYLCVIKNNTTSKMN